MDKQWCNLLLACIGQALEPHNEVILLCGRLTLKDRITGATISLRKGVARLCVWTRDADAKDENLEVGRALKKALELSSNFVIYYKGHWDKSGQQGRYSL